jgi:hypothetical protein
MKLKRYVTCARTSVSSENVPLLSLPLLTNISAFKLPHQMVRWFIKMNICTSQSYFYIVDVQQEAQDLFSTDNETLVNCG